MPTSSSQHGKARRPAQAVTSARRSLEEDRSRRMWQYLLAMGIRTAAFPVAIWAFTTQRYAVAWVAVALAVVIPSFAVMLANAVDHRQAPADDAPRSPARGLGPATRHTPTDASARSEVLEGEVVTGTVVSPTGASSDDRGGPTP